MVAAVAGLRPIRALRLTSTSVWQERIPLCSGVVG
jgi:hypothetical protein